MYDFETLYQEVLDNLIQAIGYDPGDYSRADYVDECFVRGQDPDEYNPKVEFVIEYALEQRKRDPQWPL